jgi:hypothetical protein
MLLLLVEICLREGTVLFFEDDSTYHQRQIKQPFLSAVKFGI